MGAELEAPAKPLLTPMVRGHETQLEIDEQQLVAGWAIKTAAMLNLTFPPAQRIVPPVMYEWLREGPYLIPPPRVGVVLAAYAGRLSVFGHDLQTETVGPRPVKIYTATVAIHHLVFKMSVARKAGRNGRFKAAQNATTRPSGSGRSDMCLRCGPRRFVLDDEALEVFGKSPRM